MNRVHRWLCNSSLWRKAVEEAILPWALEGIALKGDVLEVGPGPGVTTSILCKRVERLTCIEIDPALAGALDRKMSGGNVTVVPAAATRMS